MPINISIPSDVNGQMYLLLVDLLRRAVDGSVPIPDGKGLVLLSPNGTKYRLGVANDGAITTTPV